MANLVEIAAKHVKEWPKDVVKVYQRRDGHMYAMDAEKWAWEICVTEQADDFLDAEVTREQWESERTRIELSNDIHETVVSDLEDLRNIGLATDEEVNEAKRIATNRQVTQDARDIAQGDSKRSKEDQALWDDVAIAAMQSLMPIYWDSVRDYSSAEEMKQCHMESSFEYAAAFMAERAKRLDNSHTTSSTT